MWIVIKGGPIDGYEFYGPFASNDEAEVFMDAEANEACWCIKLLDPTEPEDAGEGE